MKSHIPSRTQLAQADVRMLRYNMLIMLSRLKFYEAVRVTTSVTNNSKTNTKKIMEKKTSFQEVYITLNFRDGLVLLECFIKGKINKLKF